MFDIGFSELLVCAIVALLVLGPERLPGAVRTIGRWVGRARQTVNQFTDQIDREIRAEEMKKRIEDQMKKAGVEKSVMDDVTRQVNDALRTPVIGAEHLRGPDAVAPRQKAVPAPASPNVDVSAPANSATSVVTAATAGATSADTSGPLSSAPAMAPTAVSSSLPSAPLAANTDRSA